MLRINRSTKGEKFGARGRDEFLAGGFPPSVRLMLQAGFFEDLADGG